MSISYSDFIEGKITQDHPENIKLGTEGSWKLVNLMQYAFIKDFDFYPIIRSFIASTYDTILFISTGKNIIYFKDNDMLVSSVHDNKTKIYYKKSCDNDDDDDENAKGMRVKITLTFTGEGQVFNQYVTVSGLTESNIPSNECLSGIIVVPIQVISMERNRDPNCQKNGYVVFLINTVSEESVHLKNNYH